jgi:hypothetical protein
MVIAKAILFLSREYTVFRVAVPSVVVWKAQRISGIVKLANYSVPMGDRCICLVRTGRVSQKLRVETLCTD